MKTKHVYYVDVPDLELDHWRNVGVFKTKKEALKFARKTFGADKDGKIDLVSRVLDVVS